jgi:hypothetical protein
MYESISFPGQDLSPLHKLAQHIFSICASSASYHGHDSHFKSQSASDTLNHIPDLFSIFCHRLHPSHILGLVSVSWQYASCLITLVYVCTATQLSAFLESIWICNCLLIILHSLLTDHFTNTFSTYNFPVNQIPMLCSFTSI